MEQEKYQGIYSAPEEFPKYGHTNHGKEILRPILRLRPESLIDVGCGWNEFCALLKMKQPGLRAIGVDFACPGADVQADATALPFEDKSFDVLTSFDMLEHLRPEQVDLALSEFARISRRFVFEISYRKSYNKFNGEGLHPTVRNEAWWNLRLVRAGGRRIRTFRGFIFGEWQQTLEVQPSMSVIAVGNGPSILKCDGREIDSFDCVIRFNRYQIGEFSEHTGTKTSIWATNGMVSLPGCDQRPEQILQMKDRECVKYEARINYRLPFWFQHKIDEFVTDRSNWRRGFPEDYRVIKATCGLLAVAWLIRVIGVQIVHLAGFDHLGAQSGLHHYWGQRMGGPRSQHEGAVEASIFSDLKESGRVKYLA